MMLKIEFASPHVRVHPYEVSRTRARWFLHLADREEWCGRMFPASTMVC